MQTVRERAEAICAKNNITMYRLSKLLDLDQVTLGQKKEGSKPMHWLLLRCEEEGLGYFERKLLERDGGK
jgi:hypothetical protein